jgi:hypothetical protein
MHKNTFPTTSDVKKVFFKDLILVAWKCIKTFWWSGNASKHVLNHSRGKKNNF